MKTKKITKAFGICLILLNLGCKNDVKIGDPYQGGIVFYVNEEGGGLVAAISDQSSASDWSCVDGVDQAVGKGIGSGESNTENIYFDCINSETAAKICRELELNGFDDWYLPSKDELIVMYNNIGPEASGKLSNIGNFYNAWYWSSTALENFTTWGWAKHFGNGEERHHRGYHNAELKGVNSARVRAIRSFE